MIKKLSRKHAKEIAAKLDWGDGRYSCFTTQIAGYKLETIWEKEGYLMRINGNFIKKDGKNISFKYLNNAKIELIMLAHILLLRAMKVFE